MMSLHDAAKAAGNLPVFPIALSEVMKATQISPQFSSFSEAVKLVNQAVGPISTFADAVKLTHQAIGPIPNFGDVMKEYSAALGSVANLGDLMKESIAATQYYSDLIKESTQAIEFVRSVSPSGGVSRATFSSNAPIEVDISSDEVRPERRLSCHEVIALELESFQAQLVRERTSVIVVEVQGGWTLK